MKTSLAFLGFTVLSLAFAGCASDADAVDDADDSAVVADEQNFTGSTVFTCGEPSDDHPSNLGSGSVRTVRVSAHPEAGYDRFVIELTRGSDPRGYYIRPEAAPVFKGTGSTTRVAGQAGLSVVYYNAGGDLEGGPKRVKVAGGSGILEAAEYEDFEMMVGWGIGTKKNPCYRDFTLSNPPRIVVDVKR